LVTESGNTARTSLGLGTSDSPSFLGLTVSGLTANQYVRTTTGGQLTSSATVPWSDVSSQPTILSSLDGVSNDEAGIDLIAGGIVAITPDDTANTITITATEAQQLFNTFAVSGQNSVVADSLTDTLTLVAGTNVSITTNDSADSITINATDTNTTYSAGNGLSLATTTFKLGGEITEDTRLYDGTNEYMFIDVSTGNVGIGTTLPGYELDVNGSIRIAAGSDLYLTKGGNTIGIQAQGTSASTSGAYLVGTFDEFDNSSSTTVQGVLNDFDAVLTSATGGAITAVGDVNSGDAFTSGGTQGTSLWFYDAQGRGQLTIADLTQARTYTLPDASGTFAFGTGTQNMIPRWTATNTLGTGSIYDNGTNVGIGTTLPGSYALNVNGSLIATSFYSSDGTQGADATVSGLVFKDGYIHQAQYQDLITISTGHYRMEIHQQNK
jgi:hypothetical protein